MEEENTFTIHLPKTLNTLEAGKYWKEWRALVQKNSSAVLIIDGKENTYCDTAGMMLIEQLREEHPAVELKNMSSGWQEAYQEFLSFKNPLPAEEKPAPALYRLGKWVTLIGVDLKKNIGFIGELAYEFFAFIKRPSRLRWQDFWGFLETVGPNALPIAALLGFILGLILSFQALMSLKRFGVELYVVNLVNISLTRELAPLMTAIILAGRTASAYAAELGTMKINREIDALTTMGLRPIAFLVLPRMLATILMTPLLNLYIILFGYIGCFAVVITPLHSFSIFFHQLVVSFQFSDFIGGMIKSFIFGIFISAIGCIHGLKTAPHAAAVGKSTTQAVVSSIITLGIVDGILSSLFYLLRV